MIKTKLEISLKLKTLYVLSEAYPAKAFSDT